MFSSSSSRSKFAAHGAGTSTSPTTRDAASDVNTMAANSGIYPAPNTYTPPTIVLPPSGLPSTPQSSRLRPGPRPPLEPRDSVLRASILDTALELGVGSNSAVEKWMFGAIGEVDEEAEETNLSPSLTYASTATSDESWLHSSTSSWSQQSNELRQGGANTPSQRAVQFVPPSSPPVRGRDASIDSAEIAARVDAQAEKKQGKKLRKSRPSDGYVSDGGDGYISEGDSSKLKAKKSKKKEKGGDSDGGYLSDVLRRRRNKDKDKGKKTKADASNLGTDVEGDADDTDGGYMSGVASFVRSRKTSTSKVKSKATSKTGSNDPSSLLSTQSGAEESDGGYLSSSSVSKKRRFFRLRRNDADDTPRSSKDSIPPVPALPKMAFSSPGSGSPQARSLTPLPIAERFASRGNTPLPRGDPATPSSSFSLDIPGGYAESSRAVTPMSSTTRASESSENDRPYDRSKLTLPPASPSLSTTSLESPRLTHAFKDAESVRTPSIDVLRAFGRQAGMNVRDEDVKAYLSKQSPDRANGEMASLASASYASLRDSAEVDPAHDRSGHAHTPSEGRTSNASDPGQTHTDVPTLNFPNTGPKIKRNLSKKQTPAPLTGVGPDGASRSKGMDVRSYEVLKGHVGHAPSDDLTSENNDNSHESGRDADLTVDVTPATPRSGNSKASESPVASVPRARSPSPSLSLASGMARPNALGKYDLPPPSPPPVGPLPQVPPPPGAVSPLNSPTTSPSTLSPHSRFPPPSPLVLDSPSGKRTATAPPSPLSRSSFTQDDISPRKPVPPPSPTRQHFLTRKLSKRPGTAPASPGPTNGFSDSTAIAEPAQPETAPSSPPSAHSRLLGFGRMRTLSRPGTAPSSAGPSVPPTAFSPAAVPAKGGTAPLSLKRVNSNSSVMSAASTIQRGRELPFPSKPVVPVLNRPPSRSASPIQPVTGRPLAPNGMNKSSGRANTSEFAGTPQALDVKWQPRAVSPLAGAQANGPQPRLPQSTAQDNVYDDRSSWVDFDDSPSPSEAGHDGGYFGDTKRFSPSGDKRQSVASYESQPDIESVLETLNGPGDEHASYLNRESRYSYRDDHSVYPDDEDEDEDARDRETAYYTSASAFASDAEDAPAEAVPLPRRASMLLGRQPAPRASTSPSPCPSEFDDDTDDVDARKSRASILDQARSGSVRERLVKRVERMRKESESRARI